MRLTQDELRAIFEKALENKQAFFVDWKFTAEDVTYNVKQTIPELDISATRATQIYGDWIEKVTIEGSEYQFNIDSETIIYDIIKKVNDHLIPQNQVLISWDYQDDNISFILIRFDELSKYEEMGFYRI